MDHKKLAAGLLSGCPENCADCEYAGESEFECTIAQLAATAITDLLARAEAAEAAHETLQRAMAEYKNEAEKAEHDMKRIVNQSSYPCEYCTKRKCSSTIRKRKCFDFEWRGHKEE